MNQGRAQTWIDVPRAFQRMMMTGFSTTLLLLLAAITSTWGAELQVNTDFEGGSGRIEGIDREHRIIRMMPGGDPQRGWPCWWSVRIDGLEPGQIVTVSLRASDQPARNNGEDTGKPLSGNWAMPLRASYSRDGKSWLHTEPARRVETRMHYEVSGNGGPLWVAWGPPFTPRDTDELIMAAESANADAKGFELARTRENRSVRALRVVGMGEGLRAGIWIQARQHAWESGASWVARGLTEWLTGDSDDARYLRSKAEVVIVPIMDVDNVATGNGGKEAAPRDHNRDWTDRPIYPEIAAAQKQLRDWAAKGRMEMFVDLHNPGAADFQPFFFVGPEELLSEVGRKNRAAFLESAHRRIVGPLSLQEKPRTTGAAYHPLWRQMSGQWVNAHGNSHTVAVCLETSWNTPHSTTTGYQTVGEQLGRGVASYMRHRMRQ